MLSVESSAMDVNEHPSLSASFEQIIAGNIACQQFKSLESLYLTNIVLNSLTGNMAGEQSSSASVLGSLVEIDNHKRARQSIGTVLEGILH